MSFDVSEKNATSLPEIKKERTSSNNTTTTKTVDSIVVMDKGINKFGGIHE